MAHFSRFVRCAEFSKYSLLVTGLKPPYICMVAICCNMDALLFQVACETATKTNMVMVFGEITTSAKVDYEKVVRDTCREIGFISDDVGLDADKCKVSHTQSWQTVH